MTTDTLTLDLDTLNAQLHAACVSCGASEEVATAIVTAGLDAEMEGSSVTGISHLVVYCEAMRAGRVDGYAEPHIENPTPVMYSVDAKTGFPHVGFDREFESFCAAAKSFGVALFASRNGFTCGNLGYFSRRLAERGLVALAATNAGPAMLAASGSNRPVFATNPIAFAAPRKEGPPLLIDQSSSATAWINIFNASQNGEDIPAGWALDAKGQPTRDPSAALKGALLAAGGDRGANIGLLVEMLSAGVTGANWSLDAPSFADGADSPGVGLFVIALAPNLLGGSEREQCFEEYFARLENEFNVYLPGKRRHTNKLRAQREGLDIKRTDWERFLAFAARPE
ncbi:MAG: Ldh family oxidoreductase [Pseudomonadota bacterium]